MKPLRFDGYHLGELNFPVLYSRCRRATSNYAELWGEQLGGRFALQSPEFEHVLIDFVKLGRGPDELLTKPKWYKLLLNYFFRVSRLHFQSMWMNLNRTQVLSDPFNASLLDAEYLQELAAEKALFI